MAVPPSPQGSVQCAKCGQRLAVRPDHMGREGKCHQCGHVFVIGGGQKSQSTSAVAKTSARHPVAQAGSPPPKPAVEPSPATFTFSCSLCQTRLTVPVAEVGKSVKCPDCHRKNVIPEPPKPKVVPIPAAMSGPQFDLWGLDNAPTAEQITARTPTLHPVFCSLCQTLMYATDQQVGTKLKCPDCGRLTLAKAREMPKARGPVLVPAGEEYQLEETTTIAVVEPTWTTPMIRPVTTPPEDVRLRATRPRPPSDPVLREVDAAGGAAVRTEVPPTPSRRKPSRPPRPADMPAVPLVQGVASMLLTGTVLGRWAALSVVLSIIVKMVSGIGNAMGPQALFLLPFFAIGLVAFTIWTVSAFSLFLAIITESSEGKDEIDDPPSWVAFEIWETMYIAMAAAGSTVLGWVGAKAAAGAAMEVQWSVGAAGWLLAFPLILLSMLDLGSPLSIFSPRLGMSLLRCAGQWLLFYILSGALVAASGYVILRLLSNLDVAIAFAPWIIVATLLVYMRLIGRLAWWIAECTATFEETAADG